MEAFRWDPCFLTGLPTVDEQHHYLVNLINQFGQALMRAQGASAEEVDALSQELQRYADYHFQDEEALMVSSGVYASHVAHHRKEHAQFLQSVVQMQPRGSLINHKDAQALLNFLSNWLAYHILGTDVLMTWLMRSAQKGTPVEEALETFQKSRDPATATLLEAMNRLVSQLSARSRDLFELNQTLEARVTERTQSLSDLNQRLETLAMTDVLTSLPNRRQAMQVLEREWQTWRQSGAPMSCMMVDADGFKSVNDSCGHDVGDTVLRELAHCLQHAVRNDDVVCRLGGDEFLILCANTSLSGALLSAEKVRREVAKLRVPAGSGHWVGSVSIGVATSQPGMANAEALLKSADDGVYLAKQSGRNCVASAQHTEVA